MLRVDGRVVHNSASTNERRTIRLDATQPSEQSTGTTLPVHRVEVRVSSLGKVRRATAHNGPYELDFDAPEGSRAARLQAWGREHPLLYAARFVVEKVVVVLVALFGLGALISQLLQPLLTWLLGLIPDISWPRFDLSWVPRFDLSWIPRPEFTLPAWLAAVLDQLSQYSPIISPLLLGVFLALFEVRRQSRQRKLRVSGVAHETGDLSPAGEVGLHQERARLASALRAAEAHRRTHGAGSADPAPDITPGRDRRPESPSA